MFKGKKIKCIVHRDKGIPGQGKCKVYLKLSYSIFEHSVYLQRAWEMTWQLEVPVAKTGNLSLVCGCAYAHNVYVIHRIIKTVIPT